ncbi:MAG: hypothetical protein A3F83_07390 [Candidatus Glassbacteria bacterium RIFCSPLOWO2_12_FULL_58_11]|uniref:Uncharacterized protein n=2 Tax=Candidatus Glassiibacteriota TaxID=1817805 RepID=A0A1F5YKI5_9BACT|nr:MAG: hypothetical protein A2Z86_08650 [Candidatus Glassbacteria bacterium GWA2_58_10]OGG00477.1 MAG: hypothetical protein A3F83_07390 [Candidatus Glassbacteria bacterium RIFCSPLOWO2_12_FULL_58_11]
MLVLLLATVCSAYAAIKLDIDGYFTIRQVTVDKTRFIERSALDSLCLSLFSGKSILSDLGPAKKALQDQPLIKQVRLLRKFPDCLQVQVEERKPVALVNLGELVPVDEESCVLPLDVTRYGFELPIITPRAAGVLPSAEEGGRRQLNKEGRQLVQAVIAFGKLAPDMLPGVSEFTLNEEGKVVLVTLDDGLRVVLGKWVEAKNIDYLRWMLGELKSREDKPALVDLSFEGQIVVKTSFGG